VRQMLPHPENTPDLARHKREHIVTANPDGHLVRPAGQHAWQAPKCAVSRISPTPKLRNSKSLFLGRRVSSPIQSKARPLPAVLLDPRHATIRL